MADMFVYTNSFYKDKDKKTLDKTVILPNFAHTTQP